MSLATYGWQQMIYNLTLTIIWLNTQISTRLKTQQRTRLNNQLRIKIKRQLKTRLRPRLEKRLKTQFRTQLRTQSRTRMKSSLNYIFLFLDSWVISYWTFLLVHYKFMKTDSILFFKKVSYPTDINWSFRYSIRIISIRVCIWLVLGLCPLFIFDMKLSLCVRC